MELVFLGLGSNQGDSVQIIKAACDALCRLLEDTSRSRLWMSTARYVTEQPAFINCAIAGKVDIQPLELLSRINEIERQFGRNRQVEQQKGPRTLDIDILLFGEKVVEHELLTIPHKSLLERKFALLPILDIDPSICLPLTGARLALAATLLGEQGIYVHHSEVYDHCYK